MQFKLLSFTAPVAMALLIAATMISTAWARGGAGGGRASGSTASGTVGTGGFGVGNVGTNFGANFGTGTGLGMTGVTGSTGFGTLGAGTASTFPGVSAFNSSGFNSSGFNSSGAMNTPGAFPNTGNIGSVTNFNAATGTGNPNSTETITGSANTPLFSGQTPSNVALGSSQQNLATTPLLGSGQTLGFAALNPMATGADASSLSNGHLGPVTNFNLATGTGNPGSTETLMHSNNTPLFSIGTPVNVGLPSNLASNPGVGSGQTLGFIGRGANTSNSLSNLAANNASTNTSTMNGTNTSVVGPLTGSTLQNQIVNPGFNSPTSAVNDAPLLHELQQSTNQFNGVLPGNVGILSGTSPFGVNQSFVPALPANSFIGTSSLNDNDLDDNVFGNLQGNTFRGNNPLGENTLGGNTFGTVTNPTIGLIHR